MRYFIALISFTLISAGCSNKNIELVKKTQTADPNFTLSQVLDNNENCRDTTWKSFKDKNGRDIVSYVCDLKFSSKIIENIKGSANNDLKQQVEIIDRSFGEAEASLLSKIKGIDEDSARFREPVNGRSAIKDPAAQLEIIDKMPKLTREEYWWNHLVDKYKFMNLPKDQFDKIADDGIAKDYIDTKLKLRARLQEDLIADAKNELLNNQNIETDNIRKKEIQQIIDFLKDNKENYFSQLNKLKVKGESNINNFNFDGYKFKQSKFFLVTESGVRRSDQEFYINDTKIETNIDDELTMAYGMESPANRALEVNWWGKQIKNKMDYGLDSFPYRCDSLNAYGCWVKK